MPTANEVRQQFLDFFAKKHGHTIVPSSPVVPQDDPTLLFTNAGMNQFKDVFLGTGTRPYKRAVDTQKCIRAGGKHNDLDDVGKDTYHHTFFEMLGNWSFGDYFKKEAIRWAWELLTDVWKLDKGRLHATVFEGSEAEGVPRDEDAYGFWKSETDIDPSHIHFGNKKDNFWEMGETGPCGPCSEIHYDRTPDKSGGKLVNAGSPLVIEIWNLVFIQFNRAADKKLTPLPAKHVDTGMGFERVTAVLQGKESNYDTDVFTPVLDAIGSLVSKKYYGRLHDLNDVAFRVIADHLRMLTFAIADGALPGNKGRGAVLRSVLRRAFRFGYQCFGQREPFIWKLVPALVDYMGAAYPELRSSPDRVQDVIRTEETDFLRTIDRGLVLFAEAAKRAVKSGNQISGQDVFDLYTTHGFPPDLTQQMAQEANFELDVNDFVELMRKHEEKSRVGQSLTEVFEVPADDGRVIRVDTFDIVRPGLALIMPTTTAKTGKTEERIFGVLDTNDSSKWSQSEIEDRIMGWLRENAVHVHGSLRLGEAAGIVTKSTCFYAEAGGQVGDKGTISTPTGRFRVVNTVRIGQTVVHIGAVVSGHIDFPQTARLRVDPEREFTRKNHTATHLLHWALHKVLGEHVEQRGSKVKSDEFTFDFSHTGPMTRREMNEVERLVNEKIYEDLLVNVHELPIQEARKLPGVRAFFGDKYGDEVRVVEIGDGFSREFCGGTHLVHTGQAGYFAIVREEAVGKGVRRLTCRTAAKAVQFVQQELLNPVLDLVNLLHCEWEKLPDRVKALQEENKKLHQQLRKSAATDLQSAADKLLAAATETAGAKVIIGEMPAGAAEAMRQQVDRLRQKAGSAVVVLGWPTEDGKVQLMAAVTDDLVKKGLHAGKLVGQVAKVVGGGGGGKPTMAEAGGKEPAKLGEALQLACKLVGEQLRN